MTELRRRMIEDMKSHGFSQRTQARVVGCPAVPLRDQILLREHAWTGLAHALSGAAGQAPEPAGDPEPTVRDLLGRVETFKRRPALDLIYSRGLRLLEATHLRLTDVDAERMQVWIRLGKGGKNRYVPLGSAMLAELREYQRRYNPKGYLFPGNNGRPLHARACRRPLL